MFPVVAVLVVVVVGVCVGVCVFSLCCSDPEWVKDNLEEMLDMEEEFEDEEVCFRVLCLCVCVLLFLCVHDGCCGVCVCCCCYTELALGIHAIPSKRFATTYELL